jgi:hypothetical protein
MFLRNDPSQETRKVVEKAVEELNSSPESSGHPKPKYDCTLTLEEEGK